MGNVLDYLSWRGDISIKERPFNEVDNLLMSEMVYAKMEQVITPGERLTIGEAAQRYDEAVPYNEHTLGALAFVAMGKSERFRSIEIHDIESYLDESTQFAALCAELPDHTTYIAFRGTDDTITGWREDFATSYSETRAQQMAADYLNRHIVGRRKYRVGGHSKGGLLAVYGAMKLDVRKQRRIMDIYNHDGPGISPENMDRQGYERIRDRIVRIVPAYSIFGRLFELDVPAKIVVSSYKTIMQHDGMSWEVQGTHFTETDVIPEECRSRNAVIKSWIASADLEERENFTRNFFDALEAAGAKTTQDLKNSGFKGMKSIVDSLLKLDGQTKESIQKLLVLAGQELKDTASEKITGNIRKLESVIKKTEAKEKHAEASDETMTIEEKQ